MYFYILCAYHYGYDTPTSHIKCLICLYIIYLSSRRSVVDNALHFKSGGPGFDPRPGDIRQDTIYVAHMLSIVIDIRQYVSLYLVPHHLLMWES